MTETVKCAIESGPDLHRTIPAAFAKPPHSLLSLNP